MSTDDIKQQSPDSTEIFRMPSADATVPDLMAQQKPAHPVLTIVKGPQTGQTFELNLPQISLGRDPKSSVFLNDMTVSRNHATIDLSNLALGYATIEDLDSLNGTWVDGAIINKATVVKKLQTLYPDLSVSKVRYLQDEGLLTPTRTAGGYRLYSQKDVKRLETILYLQKSRFMPLSVIREELDRQDKTPEAEQQVKAQTDEATGVEAQATPEAQSSSRQAQPQLDGKQVSQAILGATHADAIVVPVDDPEVVQKYHAIDRIPEIVGCSVGFVRQLSEAGVITLKRSPHGRDLVDGKDLTLIRLCSELRHFGFEPKNLRQYVMAANRESSMFAKSLVVYAKKGGGVEVDHTDETRQKFMAALTRMLGLTNAVRNELITKLVRESFKDMHLDE